EVCPMPIFIKLKPDPESGKAPLIVGGLNRSKDEMKQPVVVLADVNNTAQDIELKVDSIMEGVGIKSVTLYSTDDPNFREGVHSLVYVPDTLYPSGDYYTKGSTITLFPASTNTYKMKAGYSYTYNIVMQTILGKDTLDGGCEVGTIPFTVSVVPQYLRWDPQDDSSTHWNNPGNWIGIDENNNPIHTNARFAPLNTTAIIIPNLTNGKSYPVLPDPTEIAPADSIKQVGFQYNQCDNIRFMPGAALSQQQYMQYTNAIVDMPMPQEKWAFRAAPVTGMITGDVFMANADINNETPLWEVGAFDASGRSATTGNASFWMSLYSRETYKIGNNDNVKTDTAFAAAEWSKVTNATTLSLPPAQGWAVYSRTASGKEADVRLPKNDDVYYYYTVSGDRVDDLYEHNLQSKRDELAGGSGKAGKLAFNPDADYQNYTITNGVASTSFVFGNPTMGYIDIWGFIADNRGGGTADLEQTISYLDETTDLYSTYTTVSMATALESIDTITNLSRYLPPMHAIVLTAASATSISVKLNANRIVTKPSQVIPVPAPAPAVRRSAPALRKGIMTVTAVNSLSPMCKSRLMIGQGYHKQIVDGEDASLATINTDKYSSTAPATPFNLYAVEDGKGLCINLRDSIINVPLSFYMTAWPFNMATQLWFTGVNNIDGQLVLYDDLNGTELPIMDGICLNIETPTENNVVRYYIRRPGYDPSLPYHPVATDIDELSYDGQNEDTIKIIRDGIVLIQRGGSVYTMFGQKIQ
ncbi:MAG: hypothetical protein J6W92_02780, partial [Paludibacteraceae bacterium]|nr:hypothetical protein [Paludibacteraceae bacterium]